MSTPALVVALVAVPVIIGGVLTYAIYRMYRARYRFPQINLERGGAANHDSPRIQNTPPLPKFDGAWSIRQHTGHMTSPYNEDSILPREPLSPMRQMKGNGGGFVEYYEQKQRDNQRMANSGFSQVKLYGGATHLMGPRGRFPVNVNIKTSVPKPHDVLQHKSSSEGTQRAQHQTDTRPWTDIENCNPDLRIQTQSSQKGGIQVNEDMRASTLLTDGDEDDAYFPSPLNLSNTASFGQSAGKSLDSHEVDIPRNRTAQLSNTRDNTTEQATLVPSSRGRDLLKASIEQSTQVMEANRTSTDIKKETNLGSMQDHRGCTHSTYSKPPFPTKSGKKNCLGNNQPPESGAGQIIKVTHGSGDSIVDGTQARQDSKVKEFEQDHNPDQRQSLIIDGSSVEILKKGTDSTAKLRGLSRTISDGARSMDSSHPITNVGTTSLFCE